LGFGLFNGLLHWFGSVKVQFLPTNYGFIGAKFQFHITWEKFPKESGRVSIRGIVTSHYLGKLGSSPQFLAVKGSLFQSTSSKFFGAIQEAMTRTQDLHKVKGSPSMKCTVSLLKWVSKTFSLETSPLGWETRRFFQTPPKIRGSLGKEGPTKWLGPGILTLPFIWCRWKIHTCLALELLKLIPEQQGGVGHQ